MTITAEQKKQFEERKAEFLYCEDIIRSNSKSFYKAFSQLPKEKAWSVYAVYAFCRIADDSIDVKQNPLLLSELEKELVSFEKGDIPDHPMWHALNLVFQIFDMNIQAFFDMLEGQKKDIHFHQPENQEELEEYCYYVAGTVGLMLLPILSDNASNLKEQAVSLGCAMQITNILRDVGEDLRNKRIYLPKKVMQQFAYNNEQLENHEINGAFIDLWEFEAGKAEDYYQKGMEIYRDMEEDSRKPFLLALLYYREILAVIRKNQYQCFTKRNYIGIKEETTILKEYRKLKKELLMSE